MFTIGEFSKLSHVSARMLRHYDLMGLLRPAHTGADNGYRYYDPVQLSTLMQIETLKGYGFSLAEVAELLPLANQELARRIHIRRLKAHSELEELKRSLRRMENHIIQMEGTKMALEKYHVIVMENPAQQVLGIRKTISISQTDELFQQLHMEVAKRGLKRSGATQLLFMGEEFDYANMDVEAQVEVVGEDSGVKTLPACTCIATTHIGPYETVKYAYEAICAWMAEHPEYKVCGPAIERYIKDEAMTGSPEDLETGVLFPVTKA